VFGVAKVPEKGKALLLTKENPLVSLEAASAAHVRGAKAAPRKTSSLIGITISIYLRGRSGSG